MDGDNSDSLTRTRVVTGLRWTAMIIMMRHAEEHEESHHTYTYFLSLSPSLLKGAIACLNGKARLYVSCGGCPRSPLQSI